MANKLVLSFNGTDGNVTFSYGYAKSSPSASSVKTLATRLIANGSIFNNPPVSVRSAKVVITTENSIDLED